MKQNISAFTAPGCNYPPYFSANVLDATREIEITVRSAAKAGGSCGDTSCIVMSPAEFQRIVREMFSFACTQGA
jgi:hypothetical protein